MIVEDGAHNLRSFNRDLCRLYLIDRPWNEREVVFGSRRMAGLQEVVMAESLLEVTA